MDLTEVCELLDLDYELATLDLLRTHISSERQYLVDRRIRLIAAIERICDTELEGDEWLVREED